MAKIAGNTNWAMTIFDLVPEVLSEVVPALKLLLNSPGEWMRKLIIFIKRAKGQPSKVHQLLWGHLGMLDKGAE